MYILLIYLSLNSKTKIQLCLLPNSLVEFLSFLRGAAKTLGGEKLESESALLIKNCKRPQRMAAPAAAAKSLQSCPTLCDPVDGSPPGSPVPGILQAKTLEWVAISFSNVRN